MIDPYNCQIRTYGHIDRSRQEKDLPSHQNYTDPNHKPTLCRINLWANWARAHCRGRQNGLVVLRLDRR